MTRVGVMIIGSLFGERDRWPPDMLDFDAAQAVPARIRYGRLSRSRDNAYTMILSPSAALGSAKIVPFKAHVNNIDDLVALACVVARAEKIPDGLVTNWGCIGLLATSERAPMVAPWRTMMMGSTTNIRAAYGTETAPLDDDGVIAPTMWPMQGSDGIDLLLVAATCPNAPTPTPDAIAAAMGAPPAGNGGYRYFVENRRHGINTFQDDEIVAAVKQRGFVFD